MEYLSFRIQNFKGIKDTTIHLDRLIKASIFPIVGLNESGKTTILEAIHSFNPDQVTGNLLQLSSSQNNKTEFIKRVPRDKLATFTDNISVSAIILLNDLDKSTILNQIKELDFITDLDALPDTLNIQKYQSFNNGDYKSYHIHINLPVFQTKPNKKARKFQTPSNEQKLAIYNIVTSLLPHIAYFPTFIFNFPETIYLQPEQGELSNIEHRTVILPYLMAGFSRIKIHQRWLAAIGLMGSFMVVKP